jgi:hypothetical protein
MSNGFGLPGLAWMLSLYGMIWSGTIRGTSWARMAGQVNKSKLDSITRGIMVFMTGGRDFIGPRTVAPGSPGLMFEKDSYVHFGQKEGNFNRGIPPVRLRPENRGMAGQEMPDTVYLAPDSTDRYPFRILDPAGKWFGTFSPD